MNDYGEIVADVNCKNCKEKLNDSNASTWSLSEEMCMDCLCEKIENGRK